MKLSDNNISSHRLLPAILLWAVPLALIVPNIWLDVTEPYTAAEKAVNILLPLGVYFFLMSFWRRNAIAALSLIPVMILAAFQIVLLFLYGESIIAIDMFLNVLTTNAREATELLKNLGPAILTVLVLYLPVIVLSIIALCRHCRLSDRERRIGLYTGDIIAVAGIMMLLVALCGERGYNVSRRLFPLNVTCNMFTATERFEAAKNYFSASENYRFNATASSHDSVPPIFVLVIGETGRADNWQLNGYKRATNPRLSQREGIVSFTRALSESNTTHKSVPLLMSAFDSRAFSDSIYCSRGIIDTFGEVGYSTIWLSNQQRNNSLIDFFGTRADTHRFLTDDGYTHLDMELVPHLKSCIDSIGSKAIFAVLHTYGSHFNYKERYPAEFAKFLPEPSAEAEAANRDGLINAYDNTILYTDAVLDSIMCTLEATGRPAALLYLSDHGEDIFDDSRERFLHASPTPTYWQIHVPMLLWINKDMQCARGGAYETALANKGCNVSSSRSAFHTLVALADIDTPRFRPDASLVSASYREPERLYLNDYNEAVALKESGLKKHDFEMLEKHGISYGQAQSDYTQAH